ncbi:MAG: hypothetical protein WD075_02155 [Rhodospirillales bacterium]
MVTRVPCPISLSISIRPAPADPYLGAVITELCRIRDQVVENLDRRTLVGKDGIRKIRRLVDPDGQQKLN